MKRAFFVILLGFASTTALAYSFNKYEWDGPPTVYTVGSAKEKRAICAGLAKQWMTGLKRSGEPELKQSFVICEARAVQDGFTCPQASRCIDQPLARGNYMGTHGSNRLPTAAPVESDSD